MPAYLPAVLRFWLTLALPQPASPPPLPPPPLPPTLTKRSFLPFVANNALFVDGRLAQPVKYYLVGGQRIASRGDSADAVQ